MSVPRVLPTCFSFLDKPLSEIADEFSQLPNAQFTDNSEPLRDPEFSEGVKVKNYIRNRYSNIIANNTTRVKLQYRHHDYINANRCLNGRVIISQGPLDDGDNDYHKHHADFYDMLWTSECSAIAMVTDYIEKGTLKCSYYLPDDNEVKTVGDYTVVALSDESIQSSDLKEMGIKITKVAILRIGEGTKWLTHYHFPSWSDREGTAEKVVAILTRILLKEATPLIHCSAGIGRSGTVAAVMDTYEKIKMGQVSETLIPDVVTSLRSERRGSVQTPVQYLTVYTSVKELIQQDLSDGSLQISEIKVHYPVPYPHMLSIRGNGTSLNWNTGKPLQKVDEQTYVFQCVSPHEQMEYKILLDDDKWESGPNHILTATSEEITPTLAIPHVPVLVDFNPENKKLFIRGSGPGLSWKKGVELKPMSGKYAFESFQDLGEFEFKILLNDEQWELGPYRRAEKGKMLNISPQF